MRTLILLPGLACDAELWRHQRAALAAASGVAVLVADVQHRADSLPAMAELLLAEQPGELLLAGCSMGGMVALEACRQAPHRVRGLALLGTTARADTAEMKALRGQAIVLFEQGRADEVLRANLVFAFHPSHAARLQRDYLAMVLRAGSAALVRQNRAVMARTDQRAMLPALRCPTLVVTGLADPLTPPEHAREMAAAIADARLELLTDCGHMLTWEQPDAVTALLGNWLRAVDAGGWPVAPAAPVPEPPALP